MSEIPPYPIKGVLIPVIGGKMHEYKVPFDDDLFGPMENDDEGRTEPRGFDEHSAEYYDLQYTGGEWVCVFQGERWYDNVEVTDD